MIRALLAEVRRTSRERRAALACVAAVVVLADVLAFTALGDALTVQSVDALPTLAVAVAGLVVGLDLFGRDLRSGAHALSLRTPGALPAAAPARLLVLLLAMAAVLGLETGLRAGLSALLHPPRDWTWVVRQWVEGEPVKERMPLLPDYVCGLRAAHVYVAGAVVVALWTALGSAWTRRRPPAALLALLPLAAVLVALAAIVDGYGADGMFPVLPVDAAALALGSALVAVVGVAWGWRRGRDRLAGGGVGCALRGLLVLLVAGGAASAALAAASARWVELRPEDGDVRFGSAVLGTGGRHLVIEAARGWNHQGSGPPDDAPARWSRPHVWVVDLRTRAWRDLGLFSHLLPPIEDTMGVGRRTLDPQPFVVSEWNRGGYTPWKRVWLDGATGEVRLVVRPDEAGRTFEPEIPPAWRRAVRRANTPVRDAQGRPAWIWGNGVEREGEPETPGDPPKGLGRLFAMAPSPGGWFGPSTGNSGDLAGFAFLDATTGERVPVPLPADAIQPQALDGRWIVYGGYDPRSGSAGMPRWTAQWHLIATADRTERVVGEGIPYRSNAPVVAEGVLLVAALRDPTAPEGDRDLVLWRPETEERRPVRVEGDALEGWREIRVLGRRSDGPWLLSLRTFAPEAERLRPSYSGREREALVRFDPATSTATVLVPLTGEELPRVVAMDDDGSVLAIEDDRRVVRLGPAPGARAIVFPR